MYTSARICIVSQLLTANIRISDRLIATIINRPEKLASLSGNEIYKDGGKVIFLPRLLLPISLYFLRLTLTIMQLFNLLTSFAGVLLTSVTATALPQVCSIHIRC